MSRRSKVLVIASLVLGVWLGSAVPAAAATIYWTDWTAQGGGPGFTGFGTITTPTSTVSVTYHHPIGVSFFDTGSGFNYWAVGTPYTNPTVSNAPGTSDQIALNTAGTQTLSFSQAIANPVFGFISLNGNGYAFLNQDFDILSVGCGYWGCGNVTKNVVFLPNGDIEYQLIGTGEPHGTIRFTGAFSTLSWRSLTSENWNGFTVGVQGTAAEIFPPTGPVPEPSTWVLLGTGLALAASQVRRRK